MKEALKERWKIAVVGGRDLTNMLTNALPEDYKVETLPDDNQLLGTISRMPPDLIFLELDEPSNYTFSLVREIKLVSPQTMVIVVGEVKTPDIPILAFRSHVYDIIIWPTSEQELKERTQNAISRKRMGATRSSQDKRSITLVHQLRNPLGAISGYVQQLLRTLNRLSESEIEDRLRQILSSCVRIEESLNEFLNVQRGKTLAKTPLDVNAVIESALALLVYRTSQKNILVEKSLSADLPLVRGTSQHLLEAFINVITNSIEAMKEGGRLRVETSTVCDYKGHSGKWIRVTFKDTGCGIRGEDLPKMFAPFFTTKEEGNIGLGLSIVKEIVESHHGRIEVNGLIGKGTEFSIFLPTGE